MTEFIWDQWYLYWCGLVLDIIGMATVWHHMPNQLTAKRFIFGILTAIAWPIAVPIMLIVSISSIFMAWVSDENLERFLK